MNDVDLAAIRARADAAEGDWVYRKVASAADVPALLALVDAQAARIDKALALHYEVRGRFVRGSWCHGCPSDWPCPTVRALTEDVTP